MSFFKNFILFIIFFISIKADIPILKKYEKANGENGMVIFESKDFSNGDNMYFKIKANGKCTSRNLNYEYYSTISEINTSLDTSFYVKSQTSSTTKVNGKVTSTTRYFTIKKKSEEFKDSNGDYLLLFFDCFKSIEFENTETDGAKKLIIIVVVVVVVVLVVVGVIIGVCCYCNRKRSRMRQAYMNQTPMMMYGAPQPMYPQQSNMMMGYGGQQVIVQPNGIPYNNSNIQYSNLPNNTPSGFVANNNRISQQNYNMVPQSSADRGNNPNIINEKGVK